MLRLNLSTRPFYNEGLVRLALGVAGALLLVGLVHNGREVSRLTAERRALNERIAASERATVTAQANRRALETKARQSDLEAIRRSAAEANAVIGARAFSWTALLDDVTAHLPPGVRLVAVKPARTETETTVAVAMIVRARSNADIEHFLTRLESTGRFREGLVSQSELDDDGTLRVTMAITYAAPPADAADGTLPEEARP